jgi:hypothetical protein
MPLKARPSVDVAALESCVVAVKAFTHPNGSSPAAHETPTSVLVKTQPNCPVLYCSYRDARFSTPDANAQVGAVREV